MHKLYQMTSKGTKIPVSGLKAPVSDPFYRYQMDEVNIQQIKGKTVILNIDTVASNLDRLPQNIVKFMKTQFATAIDYKGGVATISKLLDKNAVQKSIYAFIDTYVLCRKCQNPETTMDVSKHKTTLVCKSCGEHTII